MTINLSETNLPQAIFLYGPAGSGKGTQTAKLLEILPDYEYIEFGGSLRSFIAENIDNSADFELQKRAVRMDANMKQGFPVDISDLRFVIEKRVVDTLQSGKRVVIDGAGRSVAEAQWQADFFRREGFSACVFHLHITLEETINRATNRWYVPDNKKPFMSKEQAEEMCKPGQEPFQRDDDTNVDSIKTRYYKQYKDEVARVLKSYQVNGGFNIFLVNGEESVEDVFSFIVTILNEFYKK